MSGFTGFTQEVHSGLSNFESGFNSLANATEQAKSKQRLVDSQKFQIQEAYKADLQEFLKTLPMDTDQDGYQSKALAFTQSWRSKINEGNYDRQTISWMNSEFLPSKKDSMVGAVNIAKDISTDVQTATYARNFATLKGSDRSLSYDQAVSEYSTYYEKLKLSDVPMEFGIQAPKDYAKSIVAAKTLQAIQVETDKKIGNIDWDTDKTISNALGEYSDMLTPDEKVQITNNAYQYVALADARRSQQAKEESVRFSQALDLAIEDKTYCDPKEIQTYIENSPYRYSLEARSIKNMMEAYNDSITATLQRKAYIAKGTVVDTSILSSMKDENLAVELMTEQLKGQAYKLFQNGYSATNAYKAIADSDFWPDYDEALVKQAKLLAQADLAANLQSQLTADKRVATADGIKLPTESSISDPVKDQSVSAAKEEAAVNKPEGQTGIETEIEFPIPVPPLLNDTEFNALKELQSEFTNLGTITKDTAAAANPVILSTFAAKQVSQWGLKLVEEKGLENALDSIDGIKDLGSILQEGGEKFPVEQGVVPVDETTIGYAKTMLVQALAKQEAEAKTARHDAAINLLSNLRADRYFASHPEELKEKVHEYVSQGIISSDEGAKNSNVFSFVTAGTYPTIMSQIKALSKNWGSTEAERSRIQGQMGMWLANEFSENPSLYDDPAAAESIQKRLVDFASERFGNQQLRSIKDLSSKFESQDGMNLLKGLQDGSTRTLLNKLSSGELDIFINNTAQTNLAFTREGENAFEWIHYDTSQLRDFFVKQMGFADQYEDLPDNSGGNYLKFVVEANVAYAKTKAATIRSFEDTFAEYNQQAVDLEHVKAVWVGNTWAISDPEVKGLFWTPNLSAIKKPTQIDWSWGTMEEKENGLLDISSYKHKGSINGFVPDAESKRKLSVLEENLANNNQRLQTGKDSRIEQLRTKGFVARDTESKQKLDSQTDEFFRQVFHTRTVFGQGAY